MKYKQHLAEDLDYMLPGYRDRAEKKTPGTHDTSFRFHQPL